MIARRTLLTLPAAFVLATAAPAPATVARLGSRGRYLTLDVRVNGTRLTALLDSGAQMTVIDDAFAIALGLQTSGKAILHGPAVSGGQAKLARGVAIDVAGITLRPAVVVVADLSQVGVQAGQGPLAMILGRDLFDAAVVAVNIGASTLEVRAPAAPRAGKRLPLTKEYGVETIPILIDGIPARATFDLGNSGRMMVSEAFARRAGLLAPDRQNGGITVRTINGPARRPIVRLRSVEIAGRKVPVPDAIVEQADNASDALIGIDVLRHFRMICDFAHRAVWLDPV